MQTVMQNALSKHVGKVIASVDLDKSRDRVTLAFADGTRQVFSSEGDCCSTSWIEHLEAPPDVVGARLLGFEELGEDSEESEEHEFLKIYQTVFRTDRGDIVLEYRNSSNGYYGGWLYPVEGE